MSISSNSYKPRFNGWYREVCQNVNGVEKVVHRNNTYAYRHRSWWIDFGKFINEFFKSSEHVNVYDWGCSNGAETMTFIMHMFSNFPKVAEKFTPIFAKDYDPVAIKMAKKHVLPLSFEEVCDINIYTGGKFVEFFKNLPFYYTDIMFKNLEDLRIFYKRNYNTRGLSKPFDARINEEYTKYVDYEVSDILTDYKKIEPRESLVLMKNFLPYIEESKMLNLFGNLSKQMREKCVLVLGNYDFDEIKQLPKYLKTFGFKSSKTAYGVYYK